MAWIFSAFADEAADSVDGQIAALKETGLKHVDLRMVDGVNISVLPLDHARQVRAKLDAAGIAVNMFGSPIGKIDITEDFGIDVQKLRHLAQLKEIFDCGAVRMFSYFNRKEADFKTWQSIAMERLRMLAEMAGDLGLVLYHENEHLIFGDHLEQICQFRDELRAVYPNFKLIFDFDNYNQCGDDVWVNWLALRDATDAFHFKDSKRGADGVCQHVLSGQGDGQILKIITDAASRGWDGPISLEPHLGRSQAVMATGPGGKANEAFASMTSHQTFILAAEAAKGLIRQVGQLS